MRLPGFLARLALPWVVAKTAVTREWELTSEEREALARLRADGLGMEWEIRIVTQGLAKVCQLSPFDAAVAARGGVALALATRAIPTNPSRADLIRAAWRGRRLFTAQASGQRPTAARGRFQ